jgi:hypothetical protein
MAQTPYIPAQDAALDAWSANFADLITAAPATYGLIAGDATAINAVVDPWHTAYLAATNPVTRTSVSIAAKDAARTAMLPVLRSYGQQVARNPAVDNGDKTALGLNLPNSARPPIPAPTTQPTISLVSATHNQHTLAYKDQTTPTSKAKPFGAIGIELRQAIGTAPVTDPALMAPLGTITKSPTTVATDSGDVGKLASYIGRFVTRSGPGGVAQTGPWSAPLTVAIV